MLDQQVIKARRVRDEYKEHNKGTIEKPVRIDSRTIIYEKVKTDVNALKFADKIKDIQRSEAIEKRVNKARNNTAKRPLSIKTPFPKKVKAVKEPEPVPPPKPKAAPKPPKPPKPKLLQNEIYKMAKNGLTQMQISEKINRNHSTVSRHIKELEKTHGSFYQLHRRTKGDDGLSEANREVKELLDKGLTRAEIAAALGKSKTTIKQHIDKIKNA